MPRKPSGIPFDEAVALVGGEGALYALETRRNTVAVWRRRGTVPWAVIGPIILARLQAIEGTTPRQRKGSKGR